MKSETNSKHQIDGGLRTHPTVYFQGNPHAAVAAQLRMKIGYGFPLKACENDSS